MSINNPDLKSKHLSDLAIAQLALSGQSDPEKRFLPVQKLEQIAKGLDLNPDDINYYGPYKGKLSATCLKKLKNLPIRGKLILVTAMSPTPAGEGKTTTSIGLADGLRSLGKKSMVCLREPSLGPVFGMKGGATGGGFSQVIPMEEINLHFTGDFHALAAAHNLLSALIDNFIHHNRELPDGQKIDPSSVRIKRVLDMNDRALREIVLGLGGKGNGPVREGGFDIVVASEVMAIFCLAKDLMDLKERLGEIVIGMTSGGTNGKRLVFAREIKAHGAMCALLKDAFSPNLVQTLHHTPAFIHGGPFANIAHGCNSLLATENALKLADYVVTEAGFGADLGAEKFLNIKCVQGKIWPEASVLVATVRALKYHGGMELKDLGSKNISALQSGLENLKRHISNLKIKFNLPSIVALNHFITDDPEELLVIQNELKNVGVDVVVSQHWALGAKGAEALAKAVVQLIENNPIGNKERGYIYQLSDSLEEKISKLAREIYGASEVVFDKRAQKELRELSKTEFSRFPVCMAKTQSSFSDDPQKRGAPVGHTLHIKDLYLRAGAKFVVAICGDIMTMPGLPKTPAAEFIDVDEEGNIIGLS